MRKTGNKSVLIMAGGTGGHVFPGLAVAEALQQQGIEVNWLGTRQGLESQLVAARGIRLLLLPVQGWRGKRILFKLVTLLLLAVAIAKAIYILLRLKPNVVLGMGGYVSGPGGIAAWLLRRPLVIHEQNAVVGTTNRILSHFADRVLESFPASFTNRVAILTGNPIRQPITDLNLQMKHLQHANLHLLVLGGSQGALAINQVLPVTIALLAEQQQISVWHQTGITHLQKTQQAYQAVAIEATVEAFIDDIAKAYQWADLVVCRAGALTISELASVGIASILIPLPNAIDDHQAKNAAYLADQAAAVILPQSELTAQRLADEILSLIEDEQCLLAMAQAAQRLSKPQATAAVVQHCMEVSHARIK